MGLLSASVAAQERAGSIRGTVWDDDFDAPLASALVTTVETGQRALTSDLGQFVIAGVPPGRHTLLISKEGYLRQVRTDVLVLAGQLTEVEARLSGEVTEMDEFVVQELPELGGGSEAALLKLRFESPSMIDSIGSELMSRAGASDAASALRLVSGASVQDGKYAVVRGLPDRYVNSQMNGVRLPTADEDKRAVELDQFPASVIESVQVSKTFTPDQQGDASGGAVNVKLKGVPDRPILGYKAQLSYDTHVAGRSNFLTYDGGGFDFWGDDDGRRDIQTDRIGESWLGAAGVSRDEAPIDFKWSGIAGSQVEVADDLALGGFLSFFYERDSSYYDDGIEDSYWVLNPGDPMTPETSQGTPSDGDFKTSLFDVTQGQESVQWGGLAGLGLKGERHSIGLTYLYTQTAEDTATLAEDTRGKAYFDPTNQNPDSAPFLRLETLEYSKRTAGTLQLSGEHELGFGETDLGEDLHVRPWRLGWRLSHNVAELDQPDKRQFGSLWKQSGAFPDGIFLPFKPAANFNLGNFQRIWKTIEEESDQGAVDLTMPFEHSGGAEGFLKFGTFDDRLDRTFDQETFSNFGDAGAFFEGGWDELWSEHFPDEDHAITESLADVDYEGRQDLSAWYGMAEVPVTRDLSFTGGARFESIELGIVNDPEADALWFPPGASAPEDLNPGEADVRFEEDEVLPAVGFELGATEEITLRGAYSRTVARQTFKELTPILQQEYLGGPIFIGNPDLGTSSLDNYDLRVDYVPAEGSLLSASWFEKDVTDPIEHVQRWAGFTFTTPVNYPEGNLHGIELEARQRLGTLTEVLEDFSVGANATFIESRVVLPASEVASFDDPAILAPMSSRHMTHAPEHLYNLYVTYDLERSGTRIALFYTIQGDTLVAGAGTAFGNFVPSVYAKEYDTLNLTLEQKLGEFVKLQLQAKNLTNPEIEEVYRSSHIGDDVRRSSYTKGIEYSLALSAEFSF